MNDLLFGLGFLVMYFWVVLRLLAPAELFAQPSRSLAWEAESGLNAAPASLGGGG